MKSWTRFPIALVILAATALPARAGAPGRADLSRLVVVGDSLSAGYQNGSLLDRQQVHGYAALVAAQAGVDLAQPLVAPPGIPNVLTLVSPGPPPLIVPASGSSPGRLDPFTQATNLAVPGATVADALHARPSVPFDSFTDLVLGLPGLLAGVSRSQVEWAEALQPTTVLVWLGNNDALAAAVAADASLLTPVASFQADYAEVMARLAATGATLVVANIPDATLIPHLTSAEDVAALIGAPLALVGPALGLEPGDFVTPDAFDPIVAILTGVAAGPLPGDVVLDAGEVVAIRAATDAYNAIIAAEARAKGAVLVDAHGLLQGIQARGLVVGGQRLTTAFLGGLFSLDGVHPTNTGYAVIANEFIRGLDRRRAAGISPLPLPEIARDDPLVLPGGGPPAAAILHVSRATSALLRAVLVPPSGGRPAR